jgi:hypothetical protein
MTGNQTIWLGGIDRQHQYMELVDWASACDRAGVVVPLPRALSVLEFERFQGLRQSREDVA